MYIQTRNKIFNHPRVKCNPAFLPPHNHLPVSSPATRDLDYDVTAAAAAVPNHFAGIHSYGGGRHKAASDGNTVDHADATHSSSTINQGAVSGR